MGQTCFTSSSNADGCGHGVRMHRQVANAAHSPKSTGLRRGWRSMASTCRLPNLEGTSTAIIRIFFFYYFAPACTQQTCCNDVEPLIDVLSSDSISFSPRNELQAVDGGSSFVSLPRMFQSDGTATEVSKPSQITSLRKNTPQVAMKV